MLLKLSRFFLYLSVFSVVVVLPSTFFPFIGGKDYFFRTSVELALIFFILWWGFEAKPIDASARLKEIFRHPLVLAVSLFVLVFLMASLFAYDPHAAFWSNYERGEGGFQMLHYYAFFIILIFLFREKDDWRRLFIASLAAGVLMILYGFGAAALLQGFVGPYFIPATGQPIAPTFFSRLFSNSRFQGSLGNPAYVAPYLLFSMFYGLWLLFSKGRTNRRIILYSGLILFFLIFFLLSQTRGAFVGLAAMILAALLYLVLKERTYRIRAGLIFLILLVIGSAAFYFRHTPLIQNLPGSRLLEIDFSERTFQTRLWTWGSAWQGFKERPLLGWGPENFSAVFDKYFNPHHFLPNENSETWFDRAHSVFFDYLAETGLLGLLSYLGIFAVFYWQFFKKTQTDAEWTQTNAERFPRPPAACLPVRQGRPGSSALSRRNSAVLNALLFSLPIGYLVQGLALFDVLPIYINLFIFLALANFEFSASYRYIK